MGEPHLHRVQKRALRLIGCGGAKLLARRPPVEEGTADDGHVALVDDVMQDRREGRIGKRGRLAIAEAAGDRAFDDRTARVELRKRAAEAGGGIVAGGAGLVTVGRQVGVEEYLPPQRLKLVRAGLRAKRGHRRKKPRNHCDNRFHSPASLHRFRMRFQFPIKFVNNNFQRPRARPEDPAPRKSLYNFGYTTIKQT